LKHSVTFYRFPLRWLTALFIWFLPFIGEAQQAADSVEAHVRFFIQAEALQDSGKFKESLPLLKKAIKTKPDYWEAYNLTALAQIKTEKYKEALKSLAKAERIAPMNYQSLKLRGIANYLNNSFQESKNALDTAAAVALEENIEDAELLFYKAQLMYKGKGYKEAINACEQALDYKPYMTEAMVLKAENRFMLKQYRQAILDLDDAIRIMKPEKVDYNAYKLRAKCKFELGDYKKAIGDWDLYLDAFPKEEEALISRGASKININDNSGAIADLDLAISINAKNPVSWCYRGVAKGGNKNFEEALKDINQSLKLKMDYAAGYVNRAAIKMAVKDKRGACQDLEKADRIGSETAYKLIEQYCK
jgi:tetratricopeptide (TPR) repeat protein